MVLLLFKKLVYPFLARFSLTIIIISTVSEFALQKREKSSPIIGA